MVRRSQPDVYISYQRDVPRATDTCQIVNICVVKNDSEKGLPKVYAAVLDCNSVALHVHALTLDAYCRHSWVEILEHVTNAYIPQQTKPG